jgi:hypothetical protein
VAKEPGNSFDDHQWALRFDTKFDRVTWTLGYMYGFAPTAVNFINNDVVGQPYYSPEFKRRHYIGSALDFAYLIKPFPIFKKLPTVIRAEVVYKTDNYFLDAQKWDSTNKILKSGNGYTDSDLLSGAIQFMFFFPYRCSITYQPMLNYYFGWKESFGVNHWGLSHLFLLSKFFKTFENRLILSIYTFLNTGGPVNEWLGTKSQIVFSWKFSDYIEGKLHYIDYQGSLKDPYGQYDSWDNAGWEIVYKF